MAETTPFITGADLKPFCPKIPDATLDAVAKNVDEMFCDLLPLRLKEREIGYMQHEVTMEFNRLYVCTTLLNIQSAKFKNKTLEIKTDGTLKKGLYFKEKEEMSFDPQLYLLITS
ncbi:MAG: hypothetical protein LBG59_07875 [Candidatus Peribacteria bacterium]|jgi:hypothetical protein|nr:hypothetical protein [Candidatus Peribacteria bacterium]